MNLVEIRTFVDDADLGLYSKEEIVSKLAEINNFIDEITSSLKQSEDTLDRQQTHMDAINSGEFCNEKDQSVTKGTEKCRKNEYINQYNQLIDYRKTLLLVLDGYKNFNKSVCFSNIRELLKHNQQVKIGQIEKEAGVRLGYMSRLEKEENTSEPSMEFVVSAAKLLKVSVDTLISINLSRLTPTELYLIEFVDKLKLDTVQDKLDWNLEDKSKLNSLKADENGNVYHPLFSEETFYEELDSEFPEEVSRVVFVSKSYGVHTWISGDCFNLRLKNGSILYLMDIEKSVRRRNDPDAFAKESWMYIPNKGIQPLITSRDNNAVAPLLEDLFITVKKYLEHPRIGKDVKFVIDSFMKDDTDSDGLSVSPF